MTGVVKKRSKKFTTPAGHSGFLEVYRIYKRQAIKRNLEFSLTKDDLKTIVEKNCNYCGLEPSNVCIIKRRNNSSHTAYTYSGVDRIVNEIGYTTENCVPCCYQCNVAKSKNSLEEFKEWARRLATYSQLL